MGLCGDSPAVQALLDDIQQPGDLSKQFGIWDSDPFRRITTHQHHLFGLDVTWTQLQSQWYTLDSQRMLQV